MLTALLMLTAAPIPCTATDGDTLRCGTERIRLLGIDAPELPGHCRATRVCALGDPWRAQANLTLLLRRSPVTITRIGTDRWRRTLALVTAGGTDLSCAQLTAGHATYRRDWDNGRRLAAICRAALNPPEAPPSPR